MTAGNRFLGAVPKARQFGLGKDITVEGDELRVTVVRSPMDRQPSLKIEMRKKVIIHIFSLENRQEGGLILSHGKSEKYDFFYCSFDRYKKVGFLEKIMLFGRFIAIFDGLCYTYCTNFMKPPAFLHHGRKFLKSR
jgi:hypothetical protein